MRTFQHAFLKPGSPLPTCALRDKLHAISQLLAEHAPQTVRLVPWSLNRLSDKIQESPEVHVRHNDRTSNPPNQR
jgi:hypothetical protein